MEVYFPDKHALLLLKAEMDDLYVAYSTMETVEINLSYFVASWSVITPCIKINNTLVYHIFSHAMY